MMRRCIQIISAFKQPSARTDWNVSQICTHVRPPTPFQLRMTTWYLWIRVVVYQLCSCALFAEHAFIGTSKIKLKFFIFEKILVYDFSPDGLPYNYTRIINN